AERATAKSIATAMPEQALPATGAMSLRSPDEFPTPRAVWHEVLPAIAQALHYVAAVRPRVGRATVRDALVAVFVLPFPCSTISVGLRHGSRRQVLAAPARGYVRQAVRAVRRATTLRPSGWWIERRTRWQAVAAQPSFVR